MTRTTARALIALAVLLSAPAATAATDGPAWKRSAWQTLTDGERVYVLDADLRSVSALAPATGKPLWTARFRGSRDEPRGYHTLERIDGRLWVYAGRDLIELDPRSGRILRRGETAWNRRGCELQVRPGVVGVSCKNAMWLLDRRRLKPLGEYFPKTEIHLYHDLGKPHDTVWANVHQRVIGRGGGAVVVAVEDKKHDGKVFSHRLALVGLSPSDGKQLWRTDKLVRRGGPAELVGKRRDHGWFFDAKSGRYGAFDPKTGRSRWLESFDASADGGAYGVWLEDQAALFAFTGSKARLHDGAKGTLEWEQDVPAGARAVLAGEAPGSFEYASYGGAFRLRILSPKTGRVAGTVDVPKSTRLQPDPRGGMVVFHGGKLRELSPTGKVLRERELLNGAGDPHVTAHAVTVAIGDDVVVLDRESLEERGRITGVVTTVGEAGGHVVLHVHSAPGKNVPGAVAVVKLSAP